MIKTAVILSYRVSGNDGVSLECRHWQEILESLGYEVTFIGGQLDGCGILIPELNFHHPDAAFLYNSVITGHKNFEKIERRIYSGAETIEKKLREAFTKLKPDLLVAANVFSLPMNFSLAVALAQIIDDMKMETIGRHHDFWWERERFMKTDMLAFFEKWFPPSLATLKHVVINSVAQEKFYKKTGIKAEIIWDSLDFDARTNEIDEYSGHFRKDFAIAKDDIVFLQATRLIPRKRIEIAIDLVRKLNNPRIILILAGSGGDEGNEYERRIRAYAKSSGIRHKFIGGYVDSKRIIIPAEKNYDKERRKYTLWDCYNNCDFVVYPTELEGFGNQFVEAVYFKKPVILTPYEVYIKDIKPLGFRNIEIDPVVNENDIDNINCFLNDKNLIREMTEINFILGKQYLSYDWVKRKLKILFKDDKKELALMNMA